MPSVSGAALTNYTLVTVAGNLSIGASVPTPVVITVNEKCKVYGAALPVLDGVVSGLTGSAQVTIHYFTEASSASSAGTYAINASVSGVDVGKYSFTINPSILTITKAPLSILAPEATKVYGSPNPSVQWTVSGLLLNDEAIITTATDASSTSESGLYGLYPDITGVGLENYNISTTAGTLLISKATLTVIGGLFTRKYRSDNPSFTYNIVGFVLNEDIQVLDSLPKAFTIASEYSTTGTYPVVYSDAEDKNYAFEYREGILNVVKSDQSISISSNRARVKVGESIRLTASASSDLPLKITVDDTTVVSHIGTTFFGLKEGITSIRLSQPGDTNYVAGRDTLVTFVSTSTGVVSAQYLAITGPTQVVPNKGYRYQMTARPGFSYKWVHSGEGVQFVPTQNVDSAKVEIIWPDTVSSKLYGYIYDDFGNLIKSDSLTITVNFSPSALLAAELSEQLTPLVCPPVVTDCSNSFILNFNLGRSLGSASGCSKGGYEDFTLSGRLDTLVMGNSNNLRLSGYKGESVPFDFYGIWLDYGNDGDYGVEDFIAASLAPDTVFEVKNYVIKTNEGF